MMRCEVLKQANETEEMKIEHNQLRFLDHVRQLEEQLDLRKNADTHLLTHSQNLPSEVSKVLPISTNNNPKLKKEGF
jgi:hypothetical protein